jgi:hypothetical protein
LAELDAEIVPEQLTLYSHRPTARRPKTWSPFSWRPNRLLTQSFKRWHNAPDSTDVQMVTDDHSVVETAMEVVDVETVEEEVPEDGRFKNILTNNTRFYLYLFPLHFMFS